jgi:hypothetical protein
MLVLWVARTRGLLDRYENIGGKHCHAIPVTKSEPALVDLHGKMTYEKIANTLLPMAIP